MAVATPVRATGRNLLLQRRAEAGSAGLDQRRHVALHPRRPCPRALAGRTTVRAVLADEGGDVDSAGVGDRLPLAGGDSVASTLGTGDGRGLARRSGRDHGTGHVSHLRSDALCAAFAVGETEQIAELTSLVALCYLEPMSQPVK